MKRVTNSGGIIRNFAALLAVLLVIAAAIVYGLNRRGEAEIAPEIAPDTAAPSVDRGTSAAAPGPAGTLQAGTAPTADAQLVERGRYLTLAGNCMTCHTARGGTPYAGGRSIETPFGAIYAPNLTPDVQTGLGNWNSAHFWRALHNGRSRDGRLLYPAFPYPNYTLVTREDSDAMFAYLRSLEPVRQANREHALKWPYNTQAALAVWRALFFEPGSYQAKPAQSADWNRGAYLVQGLGHCNACHASRNAFGATTSALDLSGGLIPMQNWYAPSLTAKGEASVADWSVQDIARLLSTGVLRTGTIDASVLGPMAEVVRGSTQHLGEADLRGMATYLKALPVVSEEPPKLPPRDSAVLERGARLYGSHCAQCHGDNGEGATNAYPRLAGNRSVTMDPPANLVRIILTGGFPPSTAGNPRPFGMQPFASTLSNEDIAAVTSHIRTAWGNNGGMVNAVEVNRYRSAPGQ